MRQAGLRCALSAKAHEGRLIIMDTLAVPEAKTVCADNRVATCISGTVVQLRAAGVVCTQWLGTYSAVTLCLQRFMDTALEALLAGAPRRSVLMVDTAKDGADGGCA